MWRILGSSIWRRMGVLRWADSLSSSTDIYAHTSTILVVQHVLENDNIPDDVCAILFLGQHQPSHMRGSQPKESHRKDSSSGLNSEDLVVGSDPLLTPCLLSPLALRARRKNVLLAACLSPDIFAALNASRGQWEGMLSEVVVDISRTNIRLKLNSLNPGNNSSDDFTGSHSPHPDIHWTAQPWEQSSPTPDTFEPSGFSTETNRVKLDLWSHLRGTITGLELLGIVDSTRYHPFLSLSPPLYSYLIEAGKHGGSVTRRLQDTLAIVGS